MSEVNDNSISAVQLAKMTTGTAVSATDSSSDGFVVDNLYLNTTTYDIWKCTGTNTWDLQCNIKGATGATGANSYTWIRYSVNSDGTGFVATPTASTIYIGSYTGDSETAPTDKASYTWSKYAGLDGIGIVSIVKTDTQGVIDTYAITYSDNTTSIYTVTNGNDGQDGQDGVSASASVSKVGKVATITCKTGTAAATTATISDGNNGQDGTDGVSMNLAGEWTTGTAYSNNGTKIDVVSKSGSSYACLQSHTASSVNQPPNSSYWQLLAQKGSDGQGSGDMLKSTYDTNGNGMVDMAEGLNGLTASILELNYMDGVTKNVQTQFSGKEPTITKNTAFNKNFETTVTNIKGNGTQSVGTSDNVPRSDHVHPAQTSVSGNAATATNLQTWRTVSSAATLNRWCKIASIKLDPTKAWADARIVILIEEIESGAGSMCLDIACACKGTAITGGSCTVDPLFGSLDLWSIYQNTFYVEYAVDTDSYLFNIWCQPRGNNQTFTFSVLNESYNPQTATTKFIRYDKPAYTTDALTGTIVNASEPYFAGNAATVTAMSSTVRGGAKISGTDGLIMDGETLKAAVKGLITSENDFNAQTESTSQAVDSNVMKEILDDMNGEALTGTLTAGATSITFTDAMIVTGNTIKTDYYTDVYGVSPTAVEVTTGSMTLTFDAQTVDVSVRVEIREV